MSFIKKTIIFELVWIYFKCIYFYFILTFFSYVHLCVTCMSGAWRGHKRGWNSLKWKLKMDGCAPLYECQELYSGHLQQQLVLWTTESFLYFRILALKATVLCTVMFTQEAEFSNWTWWKEEFGVWRRISWYFMWVLVMCVRS